jgi:glutamate racemase
MVNNRPIGIFDSGVGGLTVVNKVLKALPNEDIVYFGDTARVPYGTKSKQTVTRFSMEAVTFLARFKAKLIIIACNTASSLSLNTLENIFSIPILGVIEPGVREAVSKTKNRRVAAIGTNATISSNSYKKALKKADRRIIVFQQPCPLFVPLVENAWFKNDISADIARTYLSPVKAKKTDTVILGCTHYPLLKPVIKKVMGKKVNLIDSAEAVASRAKEILKMEGFNKNKKKGRLRLFVSDEPADFNKIARLFLKRNVQVKKVAI